MLGIPAVLVSDNGPPFSSHQFRDFARHLGFKHRRLIPLWPKANGVAERFMGKVIKTSQREGKPWKQALYRFLCNYRTTPHSSTQKSPYEALFA